MKITIPVEVHLLTLTIATHRVVQRQVQVGRTTQTRAERVTDVQKIDPKQTKDRVGSDFATMNKIFAQADIGFRLTKIVTAEVAAPGGKAAVDNKGLETLLVQYRAQGTPRVLYIREFADKSLAGLTADKIAGLQQPKTSQPAGAATKDGAAQHFFSSILPLHPQPYSGKMLAHELGHQLGLDDDETLGTSNLMYPALRQDDKLTPEQKEKTLKSVLEKKFGVAEKAPAAVR
jgi:hypothetical protein